MNKQTGCFLVLALAAPPALCQAPDAVKLVEELNSACTLRASSEYTKNILDNMLRSLKERRYDVTDHMALVLLSSDPSPAERRCASVAQSAARSMQAARERQFTAKINEQTARENAAHQAQKAEEDKEASERSAVQAKLDEENRRPPRQLKLLYQNYIGMQACYESRKEFRVPYVSPQELNNARTITRRDEASLLQRDSELAKQKDALWEAAKRDYSSTELALMLGAAGTAHNPRVAQLCRYTASRYSADQGQQQQQIKKDF